MSNMQVAVPESNVVSTGSNREEESELTEETTLSEVKKDLGNAKMLERTAKYEAQENTMIKEDHRQQQSESSKSVLQSVSQTVSANSQVTKTRVETSESFSMEETEEYEVEC